MSIIARARNISKRYRNVVALRDISIDIPPGITGLVGPNGAGKTTLINIFIGLLTPDTGFVEISTENRDFRWDIGVIRDKIAFPPEIKVEKYLRLISEIYGVEERRVEEVIKSIGLKEVKNKKIGSLSMGYKKRVGIAQAVVHEPVIIFADEPFTQLDPLIKVDVRDTLSRLSKDEGINLFISSHDISDLEMISDRVILINEGRISKEIQKGGEISLLLNCDSIERMVKYLKRYGFHGKIDGTQVRVKCNNLKKVLSVLGKYEGEIYGVNMATIEGVMKDELEIN